MRRLHAGALLMEHRLLVVGFRNLCTDE